MKINILYFSSTGNTSWMLKHLRKMMEIKGHYVKVFDVITEKGEWEQDCDLLGIVYPVWCSDLPGPIENRVQRMKKGKDKKMFLLGNAGSFSGDTGFYWKKRLGKMNYDVYYATHVLLPLNTCFPKFSFLKVPNEKKKIKMQNLVISQLRDITNDILEGKQFIKGKNPLAILGGKGQRLKFYKGLTRGRVNEMYIDHELCIDCNLCYKMCPSKAIVADENSKPIIAHKEKCIFCVKCYNLCPVNAVLIEEKSKNIEKYNRYKGPDKGFSPITYR